MNAKETINLEAQKRDVKGKKMRAAAEKRIPAVMYGHDAPAENLWVDATIFSKVFAQAGMNTVVSLAVDGAKPLNVLVYDFQTDPVTNEFTHIDFYLVNMKEDVEAEVPLVFTGVAAAVKELGGTLVKNYDAVVVRALPGDLPQEIEIDLTKLATFDDSIVASDITVSDKVTVLIEDANTVIASVSAPRSEEEMAALDEEVDADVSKIEGVADKEEGEEAAAEEAEEKE